MTQKCFFFTKSCAKDAPEAIDNFGTIALIVRRASQKKTQGGGGAVPHRPPPLPGRGLNDIRCGCVRLYCKTSLSTVGRSCDPINTFYVLFSDDSGPAYGQSENNAKKKRCWIAIATDCTYVPMHVCVSARKWH